DGAGRRPAPLLDHRHGTDAADRLELQCRGPRAEPPRRNPPGAPSLSEAGWSPFRSNLALTMRAQVARIVFWASGYSTSACVRRKRPADKIVGSLSKIYHTNKERTYPNPNFKPSG